MKYTFLFFVLISFACNSHIKKELTSVNDIVYKRKIHHGKHTVESIQLYTKNAKLIDSSYYLSATPCHDIIVVKTENHKYGVLSNNGKIILPSNYKSNYYTSKGDFSDNERFYLFQDTIASRFTPYLLKSTDECVGEYLILSKKRFSNPVLFEIHKKSFNPNYEGLATSIKGSDIIMFSTPEEKVGFLNNEGKVLIKPIYDNAQINLSDLYYRVILNNKWGILDKYGKQVIDCIYNEIEYKSENNYIGTISNQKIPINLESQR